MLVTVPEPVLAVVTVRVWIPLCAAQTVLVGNTPAAATNSETITYNIACRIWGRLKNPDALIEEPVSIS